MKLNWILIAGAVLFVVAAFALAVQQGANTARADAGLPPAPLTDHWQ